MALVALRRETAAYGWSLDLVPGRRFAGAIVVALALAVLAPAATPRTASAANPFNPMQDPHSLLSVTTDLGAEAWWSQGYTGAGVDIAVIDTGVAPVPCLNASGKVIHGPDLSLESQAPALRNLDTNGHGTAMAGLIAGDCGDYRGMAPGARIVSIKVGTADGGVDVSQVIAAIDWVVQHRHDNGLNIRVLNLSYGTNSRQPYTIDPLAYAAEQAWRQGIAVVAAGGNSGYQKGKGAQGLASPAYDPYVIAVGATNRNGNPDKAKPKDKETVADYSASGAGRNPDVVAPGSHLQLLRVPGSYVDQSLPPGHIFDRFFRGSGTSEAAAIVSGAAALVLQKYPWLTPDALKKFLMTDTERVKGADDKAQGKGRIDLARLITRKPSSTTQKFDAATGLGSLEISRGTDHLTIDGVILEGEQDIFGHPWVAAAITPLQAIGAAWSGGVWNGNSWNGNSWSGNSWSGNSWSGNSWSGNSWSGNSWSGNSWSGNSWSGNSWSGAGWD